MVPERALAPVSPALCRLPFGHPRGMRRLVLTERSGNPGARLAEVLHAELVAAAGE